MTAEKLLRSPELQALFPEIIGQCLLVIYIFRHPPLLQAKNSNISIVPDC
jgi:hypothetical protein